MSTKNRLQVPEIRHKLATLRIIFTQLSSDRASEAARLKTAELNSEVSALKQEILLTEMIHYDQCAQIIEAIEKSIL